MAAQADTAPPRLVTLALWADDVWLALLDRDGSYFGRLDPAGTFQRFNPLMDDEYELDLWTGLFTLAEDARWAAAEEGLRVAGTSINHPFILNFADWRESVPIGGAVDLVARYRRQRSLTTQRDYTTVGVRWRDAVGRSSALTAIIGTHFFKPSADIELGIERRLNERWTAGVRVAILDAFNDLVFNTLGVAPEESDAHFDYERFPLAARLTVGRRSPRWRAEVHAGRSTRSRVLVTFPATQAPSYRQSEQVWFAGVVADAAVSSRISLAAYAGVARPTSERRFATPASEDFWLAEETQLGGVRGRVGLSPALAAELDLRAVWRPEARHRGDGSRIRHCDRQVFGEVVLVRRPPTGWAWRVAFVATDRRAGVLAPALTAVHQRQVMEGGYRFRSGFEVAGGVRWDVDQFSRRPFDGGHLRFGITW